MALSNILNEPRREITEQAIGIAVLAVPGYISCRIAIWVADQMNDPTTPRIFQLIVGLVVGILFWVAVLVIMAIVHAIGERLCDKLEEDFGWQIRPKDRY